MKKYLTHFSYVLIIAFFLVYASIKASEAKEQAAMAQEQAMEAKRQAAMAKELEMEANQQAALSMEQKAIVEKLKSELAACKSSK